MSPFFVCMSLVVSPFLIAWSDSTDLPDRSDSVGTRAADAISSSVFARRVLGTTDLVLREHIDPPTRQQMILGGAKAATQRAGQKRGAELSRSISQLGSSDDFTHWLEQFWNELHNRPDVPDEELQAAMLDGMCRVIPGRPNIFDATYRRVSDQLSANRYVGIGIQLSMDKEQKLARIDVPFVRGPARRAGVRPSDLIVAVDGVSADGKSLEEVVQMLRGPEGSQVTLTVRQPRAEETRTFEITRGVVPLESVLGYRRPTEETWSYRINADEPIAYVRITSVIASTLHELRQAARVISGQGDRALVIDLRNHGGVGSLEHVLLVADELLGEGPIGRLRRASGTVDEFAAKPDSLFQGWPIVVLVNQFTQGDPEFLAAALQDGRDAIIVGDNTAGDAYVRQLFELPDELGFITLQTGVLERRNGESLLKPQDLAHSDSNEPQRADDGVKWGAAPHHVVPMGQKQLQDWLLWRRSHELPPSEVQAQVPADPQLDKALELLRTRMN